MKKLLKPIIVGLSLLALKLLCVLYEIVKLFQGDGALIDLYWSLFVMYTGMYHYSRMFNTTTIGMKVTPKP